MLSADGSDGKESACQYKRCGLNSCVGKSPRRRAWQPTLVFLPGESHGQRSLAGYSPWGRKESDVTDTADKELRLRGAVFLPKGLE